VNSIKVLFLLIIIIKLKKVLKQELEVYFNVKHPHALWFLPNKYSKDKGMSTKLRGL